MRTIIHVAELGSLSKAADRLNIAQPALSRQVRLLEEELGVRLFERHGRGMVISEAGQEVLRHAHRIAAEIQEIRTIQSDDDVSLKGHVSIGMPPTISDILAVPLVSAFQNRHPDATVRIVSAYSSYVLDWLHRGDVDVAILFESTNARSLKSEPLIEEKLFLIGPKTEEESAREVVSFSNLKGQPLLLPSMGHSLRALLEDCSKGHDFRLNVAIETDSYSILKNLVRAGHGKTILPLAPIHQEIADGSLSFQPLSNPVPRRRLRLSIPADRPPTRLARFAHTALQTSVKNLAVSGDWPGVLILKYPRLGANPSSSDETSSVRTDMNDHNLQKKEPPRRGLWFIFLEIMIMQYDKGKHCVFYHRYHLVWSTKYRFKIMRGAVQHRVRQITRQVCEENGVDILKGVVSYLDKHIKNPSGVSRKVV